MAEKTVTPAKTTEAQPRYRLDLFDQLQDEFDRMWTGRWPLLWPTAHPFTPIEEWSPRADVYSQNGSIVIKAELPGVKKEDIDISVENGSLIIRGERKSEEKVEETDFYRMERSHGTFYRRLPMPKGVTAEQIKAEYKDGVLKVTVPKPARARPVGT